MRHIYFMKKLKEKTSPLQALKAAVLVLENLKCNYCLIGGHAASLYRKNERLTRDVDFALVAKPEKDSPKKAKELIKSIGLTPISGFMTNLKTKKGTCKIPMITSKPSRNSLTSIIDVLLPNLPWVKDAVSRAQDNIIDLGFAKVPVICPEDLIISKCFALEGSPDRFQDLDDIKEIFTSVDDLDLDYIKIKLKAYKISIPKILKNLVPNSIQKFCK